MSGYAKLAIAIALLLAGFMAGVKFHVGITAQRDRDTQEAQAKETFRRLERGDQAAVAHEADKAKIRTEFLTITQEVERVVEKPVYRDVCFDDDGLRLIGAAISGRASASEPAPAVPGPAEPGGW